jgi:hypothetical protein
MVTKFTHFKKQWMAIVVPIYTAGNTPTVPCSILGIGRCFPQDSSPKDGVCKWLEYMHKDDSTIPDSISLIAYP